MQFLLQFMPSLRCGSGCLRLVGGLEAVKDDFFAQDRHQWCRDARAEIVDAAGLAANQVGLGLQLLVHSDCVSHVCISRCSEVPSISQLQRKKPAFGGPFQCDGGVDGTLRITVGEADLGRGHQTEGEGAIAALKLIPINLAMRQGGLHLRSRHKAQGAGLQCSLNLDCKAR